MEVTASWELDHHSVNKKQCQLEFLIPKPWPRRILKALDFVTYKKKVICHLEIIKPRESNCQFTSIPLREKKISLARKDSLKRTNLSRRIS